jgi:hypothetical protein
VTPDGQWSSDILHWPHRFCLITFLLWLSDHLKSGALPLRRLARLSQTSLNADVSLRHDQRVLGSAVGRHFDADAANPLLAQKPLRHCSGLSGECDAIVRGVADAFGEQAKDLLEFVRLQVPQAQLDIVQQAD